MKAVVYSTRSFEREYLARVNNKKHDITLISNALGADTIGYATGKEAVIVFSTDDLSAAMVAQLAVLKIRFIISRTANIDYIDREAASAFQIVVFGMTANSFNSSLHLIDVALHENANHIINILDAVSR